MVLVFWVTVSAVCLGDRAEVLRCDGPLAEQFRRRRTGHVLVYIATQVQILAEENKQLREEVTQLMALEQIILNSFIDLESRSRRNNLVFKRLKLAEVIRTLKRFLETSASAFIGRDGKTLVVYHPEDSDVQYLMSQARRKLMNTGYVVHRDFHKFIFKFK
ncbi:hypothetical protein J6590_088554 [Homalodisca vitripennis]|nr:hypothetical protein J6590_080692 [Homalodisca vitripennis]KAG8299959.1 hypothetical protein J6590_088554 [Homalodisca vitripennis]